MKEAGLDGRHRDKNPPNAGEIQQKRNTQQESSCSYSRVFTKRTARHHEKSNGRNQHREWSAGRKGHQA